MFLAYNRREDLRLSLTKALEDFDYPRDRLEVIVVDNASTDGTADMLTSDFADVRLVRREWNCGVSGWNDGFAAATGDYVLALDDDCYLPSRGLSRAVEEAERRSAHLVSFAVESAEDPSYRFDLHECMTGLLSFWGCAVLMRRDVVDELNGYDPEIFVWANELEFMLRFFDGGFRHLHLPEVVAIHAKPPGQWRDGVVLERPYRVNTHNLGYVAGKLLRPRDAAEALIAMVVRNVRDGVRMDRVAFKGILDTARGFALGLRRRRPVRAQVSRAYRHNFEAFASPWRISRPLPRLIRDALVPSGRVNGDPGRHAEWLREREQFYPSEAEVLEL